MLSALRVTFKTERLVPMLRKGLRFLPRYFFRYDTFYLYKHTIRERNEADFLPKIQDFSLEIVFTNQQADELASARGVDFRSYSIDARRRLDKGATAFCVFAGNEIAHIGWLAMTQEAKNSFDDLPYRVFFSDREACTGGTVTIPEYQGKGLMAYGMFKRLQFLGERGIIASRNSVEENNPASHKVHAKFAPEIYAKVRRLKTLRLKVHKEIPLTKTSNHD